MAKGHRRFNEEESDDMMDETVMKQQPVMEEDDNSDNSSEDSDAPETVATGTARREIEERERRERIEREGARAAKRKQNKAREEARGSSTSKGKGKAIPDSEEQVEDSATPAATTSKSIKLDPSLFLQANEAFEQAKESARLEEQQQLNAKEEQSRRIRRKKRKTVEDNEQGLKKRTIGTTTIQQLTSPSNATVSTDPTTALPSSTNEAFLRNRLFRKTKSVFGRRSSDKNKGKGKEEKPFLLFDPLLDKAPVDKKAQPKSRAASRMQMEERMRGRSSAMTAYSKANRRTTGPAVGFSVLGKKGTTDSTQGRKRREKREKV